MSLFRVSSRVSKSIFRNTLPNQHSTFPVPYNQIHSLPDSSNKVIAGHMALLQRSNMNTSVFQTFRFSSFASAEPSEKEDAQSLNGAPNQKDDSESEIEELSREDLAKLVKEKEQLLMMKQKEIASMQDKVLRTYADMENVMDRTKREAENTKKFALQSFAKGLLDVADNLNRASSVVKESFSKIDTSRDASGAVPLLKTLLEGVEMTEKQLAEVFKKFGVEKYDPTNEQFDPNRHYAVFQVPDASKPPGTVAAVLKAGYMLHDRVLRPAEVGVTEGGSEA